MANARRHLRRLRRGGGPPLIRLRRLSEESGCEILGKAEFMNPSGSVKDRAALYMLLDAERHGRLRPGGTVVEGTAGNTGIGLAHLCRARGYRCVIVIPDTQSREKLELLRTLGAEVHSVPARPYQAPDNYQKVAARLAASLDNAIWANQFDNLANRRAHFETTGPELWAQTGGRLDAFVAAALQVARQLGPGHTVVTALCDGGVRYASRLFDRCWLAERNLSPPNRP